LMSIAFIANFAVFFLRLYYQWLYNLHLLAAAPDCAKSLQYRNHHWPTLSGDDFGQACNPRIESR
jgi:hypothetical protein